MPCLGEWNVGHLNDMHSKHGSECIECLELLFSHCQDQLTQSYMLVWWGLDLAVLENAGFSEIGVYGDLFLYWMGRFAFG